MANLPITMKALIQHSPAQPLSLEAKPTPSPLPGTAVIHVLYAGINSYFKAVLNGTRGLPYPTPFIPGPTAIGRIAALGPDSTSLKVGDLVFVDCVVRSRDDPNDIFLLGFFEGGSEGSRKLMSEVYRDGTYAEFCRIPLENVFALNEDILGGRKADLASLGRYLVCYGGLKGIGIQAGETVAIAPATGGFSGAGVAVAIAMGASVIAMGRNEGSLKGLEEVYGDTGRLKTVKITGDTEHDAERLRQASTNGLIDAALDVSPPMAARSTHLRSIVMAMQRGGRISLMGGVREDFSFPYSFVVHRDLTLQGKWMYDRKEAQAVIKMVESGILKIGRAGGMDVEEFKMEDWAQALDRAEEKPAWNHSIVIKPE